MAKAAVEQIASEYQEKGYEVVREAKIADFRVDLMVRLSPGTQLHRGC